MQGDWRLLGNKQNQRREPVKQTHRAVCCYFLDLQITSSCPVFPGSLYVFSREPVSASLPGSLFLIPQIARCYASLHSQAWISLSLHSLEIPAVPPHLLNLQLFISLRHSSDGNFSVFQYRNQHSGQRQTHSGLSTNTFGCKNVLVSGWNPRTLSQISDTTMGLFSHHNHGRQGLGSLKQQPERFPSEAQVNHWPGPGNSVYFLSIERMDQRCRMGYVGGVDKQEVACVWPLVIKIHKLSIFLQFPSPPNELFRCQMCHRKLFWLTSLII